MSNFPDFFSCILNTIYDQIKSKIEHQFPSLELSVCSSHKVCWCEECTQFVKLHKFTRFKNKCDHYEAQCLHIQDSPQKINQLQLILNFLIHLESYNQNFDYIEC